MCAIVSTMETKKKYYCHCCGRPAKINRDTYRCCNCCKKPLGKKVFCVACGCSFKSKYKPTRCPECLRIHTAVYHTKEAEKRGYLNIAYECCCENVRKVLHHPDYKKPFDVERLCYRCHAGAHRKLWRINPSAKKPIYME